MIFIETLYPLFTVIIGFQFHYFILPATLLIEKPYSQNMLEKIKSISYFLPIKTLKC